MGRGGEGKEGEKERHRDREAEKGGRKAGRERGRGRGEKHAERDAAQMCPGGYRPTLEVSADSDWAFWVLKYPMGLLSFSYARNVTGKVGRNRLCASPSWSRHWGSEFCLSLIHWATKWVRWDLQGQEVCANTRTENQKWKGGTGGGETFEVLAWILFIPSLQFWLSI